MTATEEPIWSIGEVSERTGLTTHTVRFYELEGLFFAPVRRNAAGRRVFTADEVEWLKVCLRLRASGMPLPEILREHEARVRQQVADLQEALDIIHHKVELYAERLRAGTAGELWRHGPEC